MSIYLDTSVLVALFIDADVFAGRAASFFAEAKETLIVSNFAKAEFAAVVARLTRMAKIDKIEARAIFGAFDNWCSGFADEVHDVDVESLDIHDADMIIRRLDLNLRAPDAINLTIARRLGASLVTFDDGMTDNARALGIVVTAV